MRSWSASWQEGDAVFVLESTSSGDPATLRLLRKFLYTMNTVLAANESLNQLTTSRGTHTHRIKYAVPESKCVRQWYSFTVANPVLEQVNSRTHSASTVRIYQHCYTEGGRSPAFVVLISSSRARDRDFMHVISSK